jgi:4-hydroxybenzoate polyprenyltransferase
MSAHTAGRTVSRKRRGFELKRLLPVALFRASHPRQALLTSAVVTVAAALAGREDKEIGLVFATVLVGQVLLGWHNDVVDANRDRSHDRHNKPVAAGHVDKSTVWFAIACAVLLLVPLAISNGVEAGTAFLLYVALGIAGNSGLLRRTRFSYLTWMASFGLLPAFLAYGGWGGDGTNTPPTILITALAALLGIGVHLLTSLPGLVDDNKDGIRHFPLSVAVRIGAPKLLLVAALYTAAVSAGILVAGLNVGLVQ